MFRAVRALIAALAVLTLAVATASTAQAATTRVDFTVSETIDVAVPGSVTAGSVPDCVDPVVYTENNTVYTAGSLRVFRGDKRFVCDGGDELVLRYTAFVVGCSTQDYGWWRVTGGTGAFAGASGGGTLVGSYTSGGAPSDACATDGIDDHYTGFLRT